MTSHDVVNIVRRAAGEKSVGHLGTLDPMATGVLPLLLGRYTRLAQFFASSGKTYEGEIRFGFSTDTYDAEGEQVGESREPAFKDDDLQFAVAALRGKIQQMPPPFSAKKINGVPAYKLARKGEAPELKPVEIEVARFDVERTAPDRAQFFADVSSGSYIRSLAHSLGEALGCGAHLASLRRTRVGAWSLDDAVTLEAIRAFESGEVAQLRRPLREVLPELPLVFVSEEFAVKLRNGMSVNLSEFTSAPLVRLAIRPSELIGIGRRTAGSLFAPHVMFPAR